MIRCVLFASAALHVAMFALLPNARPLVLRPPDAPSLVEVTTEPPKPKEEPKPEPIPTVAPATVSRPRVAVTAHAAVTATASPSSPSAPVTDPSPVGVPADGDGPADFTASVISNAAPGPASKIVVSARREEPKMVPVTSLSRRPGAPGLDAELEKNYPIAARRSGISGNAKLRVQIHADGRVGRVEQVSESFGGFGEACTKTVRAARWEPPLDKDGRAVATEIVYVCKFEVRS